MLFLTSLLVSADSVVYSINNATNVTYPYNMTKVIGFCSDCKPGIGGSFGSQTGNPAKKPGASGVTRNGDLAFIIIQHNASYVSPDLNADQTPKIYFDLYASQHYVDIDTYSVISTISQRPYGNLSISVYTYDYTPGKGFVQYLTTPKTQQFFTNSSGITYVIANSTVSIRYYKGVYQYSYWQTPEVTCSSVTNNNRPCIGNYKTEACDSTNLNPSGDPLVLCPIKINVVFEGTDRDGKIMESVGIFYSFRLFGCKILGHLLIMHQNYSVIKDLILNELLSFLLNFSYNSAKMVMLANQLNLYHTYPDPEFLANTEHLISIISKRTMLLKKVNDLSMSEKVQNQEISMHQWHSEIEKNYFKNEQDDLISHLILRLALSNSEDSSKWLIEHELAFFANKFLKANEIDRMTFLKTCGSFEKIKQNNESYFRVEFEQVPSLVAQRKVNLENGFALVPEANIVEFAKEMFRLELIRNVDISRKCIHFFEDDPRMLQILNMFSNAHLELTTNTQVDYSSGISVHTAEDIKKTKHMFPPCMASLQDHLETKAHLKHGGRMQYGLFLKALGLPVQEALKFWKKSFKNITEDTFTKQYAYNIRHNYGLEGKKADYKPFNCSKIILNSNPGATDNHGCPFKHHGKEALRSSLTNSNWGVNKMASFFDQTRVMHAKQRVDDIVGLTSDQHYTVACSKWMESVIYVQTGEVAEIPPVEHPNGYVCTISEHLNKKTE